MNGIRLFLINGIIIPAVVAQVAVAAPKTLGNAGARGHRAAEQSAETQPSKPVEKKPEDCGCEAKTPPDVLATVGGVKILVKDVDESINDRIKELQGQVIEARKRQLELEINSRLLEAEAKRLDITPERLLERDVSGMIKEPTEAEARAFYDQNRSRIEGEFLQVKDQIIGYMRNQRQQAEAKKLADRLRSSADVKVLAESATPPESDADRSRVLATVNGKAITSGDLENALKPLIYSVQDQVYTLRKQSLDVKINDLLLEQEAKKKNITAEALFDAEILPRVKPVTEADARRFYEENKDRARGSFEQLRPQIIQYLQTREQGSAAAAYAEQLRKAATLQVFLKPPDPPVLAISIDNRPWTGGANARVTIVEFTDFECPSCAAAQPVLEELVKEFGDKVKLVERSYPLEQHKRAFKAAEAAEAAREQGKYWEYAAVLFKNQKALEIEKLKEYASQLGLDRKKFDAALDSSKFADAVKRDVAEGDRLGVDSTPTVFINGRRAQERSREALKAAIEAAFGDGVKK
jgi:protein-disulfide isomerase